jgi:ferritin-like metal-binding protein YciE
MTLTSKINDQSKRNPLRTKMDPEQLVLFTNEFEEIYRAEKALIRIIPEMIGKSTSEELAIALTGYFNTAVNHVKQFEKVFRTKKMERNSFLHHQQKHLLDEAIEIMARTEASIPGLMI